MALAGGFNTQSDMGSRHFYRGNVGKRMRQDSSDKDKSAYMCQKCDTSSEENVLCSGCKLPFCIKCAKISEALHQCIVSGEMDGFHWTCRSCSSSFPSLENISQVLTEIQSSNDKRMTTLETKVSQIEIKTQEAIQSSITGMKNEIIESMREDVNQLVDSRNRELEDRRRREQNVTIFNMPEHTAREGQTNKDLDEADVQNISSSLGLANISIKTTFRLGKKNPHKPRPLKVILIEKSHKKFLLDNAKFISVKVPEPLTNAIISKDLTPLQRQERRIKVQERRAERNQQDRNHRPREASQSGPSGIERTPARTVQSMETDRGERSPSPIGRPNGTMTHLNINDDTVLHGTPRDAYHTSTFIEDTVVGGILSQQPDELGSPV